MLAPVCSLENELSTIKNANRAVIVSPNETKYALLGFSGGGLGLRAMVGYLQADLRRKAIKSEDQKTNGGQIEF
jgi:hypothetical protein